ncbi:MAG: AGE family epimerase/isomerase [Opitutaceae bacterium]
MENPAKFSLSELRRHAEQELTEDILPFWVRHAFDPVTGRLAGVVANDLRRFDDGPRHAVICARILWTFAAAARRDPRPEWLETGRRALALLTGPFWDAQHGGVFWSLDAAGRVLADRKQVYAQAFAIYGLAEWSAATGDAAALARARILYELIERHAADPQQGGYIEARSAAWGELADMRLSGKDLNAPKSMNTLLHVLEAYTTLFRHWSDAGLRGRLQELLTVMLDHVVTAMPYTCCRLFFERDWRSLSSKISYGHDIEASWLLWDAAEALGDPVLLERTRPVTLAIAAGVLAHGCDADGAVFYEGEPGRAVQTDKHWWPQAEAVVGFLNAHALGGDPKYLAAAVRAWQFIEDHVIDRKHGEWFAELDRSGRPLPDYPEHTGSGKIGPWKCPYHNARTCLEVMRRVPAPGG